MSAAPAMRPDISVIPRLSSACPAIRLISAVGPVWTCRRVPNMAYTSRGTKEAYKPHCTGRSARRAKATHCATNMIPTVTPAMASPLRENGKLPTNGRSSSSTMPWRLRQYCGIHISGGNNSFNEKAFPS